MRDLNEATEKICEIKGELMAAQSLLVALIRVLPPEAIGAIRAEFALEREAATTVLLNGMNSDFVVQANTRMADQLDGVLRSRLPS